MDVHPNPTPSLAGSFWVMANMPSAAGASPAYPVGDKTQINAQMTDADALDPIPNAIFFNWVTMARVRGRGS